jgi:2-oxoglutarate ferredoxin oxidoreductase subunit gamma
MTRNEIRVIGYGGQGVITLSKMIAYAAVIDDKNAVQTEAYGPASRGGSCWAEVVIDDELDIDYPRAIMPNYYIILSQAGADRYGKKFCNKPEVTSIVDPLTVTKWRVRKGKTYEFEAQRIAKEEFKIPVIANIILLGVFTELTGLISKEAAIETVKKFVPPKTYDINMKAFERGINLAKAEKDKENN